ncbi:MAG: FCD domain-containing protein [Eubacteriales bacterium]|nr:FCD domain-containing protein [Eubacteriales bacterium]
MRQKTETLSERVAEKIRQYIIDHEMNAGDRLPNELQMAEYCQVGRGTVRDAIKLLRFEGLVEVVHGSGTYILKPKQKPIAASRWEAPNLLGAFSPEELPDKALEFSEVRLMLEPDIAALAAANATYADCRRLLELEAEVRQKIQLQEPHYEKDIAFHLQIARCAKNEIAYKLMELVVKGIPLFCRVTNDELANQTVKFHHMIAESIERGDVNGARYSMIDHLNCIRRRIIEELERQKTMEKSSNEF